MFGVTQQALLPPPQYVLWAGLMQQLFSSERHVGKRDNLPKRRAAARREIVQEANPAGNQAGNLMEIFSAATPRSPRLGPGRARTKDEAGCSCGRVLRVQSRMARVPGSAGTRR